MNTKKKKTIYNNIERKCITYIITAESLHWANAVIIMKMYACLHYSKYFSIAPKVCILCNVCVKTYCSVSFAFAYLSGFFFLNFIFYNIIVRKYCAGPIMSVEVRAFVCSMGWAEQRKSEKKNWILSNKIHNKIASSLWQTIFNGISVKKKKNSPWSLQV